MKSRILKDIDNYISFLRGMGLFITVHGKGISGLLEHNIHSNPFCLQVKTDSDAWQKCIQCQQKVLREYKSGQIFGMCHAGLEEYIFFASDKAFVSVSGYGIDRAKAKERINRLCDNYYLDRDELLRVYEKNLKHTKEDIEWLSAIIKPLCHMLYLLQLFITNDDQTKTKNDLFDSILKYVQRNYTQDISIKDIAQGCCCSESTVSHLFRAHNGVSVKKYITGLRIELAKTLLETSDLPISSIALMCGFSNINYFPTAFKKATGVNPSEYKIIKTGV